MKLIDKDAAVAEIERRQKEEVSYYENGSFASWADENHYLTLETIKSFFDTLEIKEVDLEKELSDYFGDGWKEDGDESEIREFARHFFKLGLKAQKGE